MTQSKPDRYSLAWSYVLLAIAALACCSAGRAQSFDDIPEDYWAASFVEIVSNTGISVGCGANNYCPEDSITRAQMAVFLERGMRGYGFAPPRATGEIFSDVGPDDFAASFIEQLYADGITSGCGSGAFCPTDPVTRDQMAVFLLRARHGADYSPPPANGMFNDVPTDHWAAAWIEQLAREGITVGCGQGNYCPDAVVTRAQMAVFVVRALPGIAERVLVANAGGNQVTAPLSNFALTAAGTSGPAASYQWTQISGPLVALGSPNAIETTVSVPGFAAREVLEFELTVTADDGRVSTDIVQVIVTLPPTAVAERERRVPSFTLVALDGLGSSDPDGSVSGYQWTQVAGPGANIVNADTAEAEFTAPEVTSIQSLIFELTVVDSDGYPDTDTIAIIVEPATAESLAFEILGIEFLRLKSEDSHGDYFPQAGDPIAGITMMRLAASGPAESAELVLSLPNGAELVRETIVASDPYVGPFDYYTEIDIPTVPFNVYVEGSLRNGAGFEASWPDTYVPRNVRLVCQPERHVASRSSFRSGNCTIENYGEAAVYDMTITDPESVVESISSTTIAVDQDSSATVGYTLSIPSDASMYDFVSATLSVEAQSDPNKRNETELSVWVQ